MNTEDILAEINESEYELLVMDGLADAIIGIAERPAGLHVVAYDYDKIIAVLMEDGLSHSDAVEHFDFNIASAWVGPNTPVIVTNLRDR